MKPELDYYLGPPGGGILQVLKRKSRGKDISWVEGSNIYYTHTARTAITKACCLIGLRRGDKVLAPSYNCGAEVDALLHSGARVELYRIKRSGAIDVEDVLDRCGSDTRAIYITHYFGFPQEIKRIKEICKCKNIYLIEDCALSLLSSTNGQKVAFAGDISILNFPKTLPVPDGGALRINNTSLLINRWERKPPAHKAVLRGLLSLWKSQVLGLAGKNKVVLNLLWRILRKRPKTAGNEHSIGKYREMPSEYYYSTRLTDRSMSSYSRRLLYTYDTSVLKAIRQENYLEYLRLLDCENWAYPLFDQLPTDVCPLLFPVVIQNRDEICRMLNDWSINAIPWWSGYHAGFNWDQYPDACYLKDTLLALPVDQSLGRNQIKYIVQKLIEAKTALYSD